MSSKQSLQKTNTMSLKPPTHQTLPINRLFFTHLSVQAAWDDLPWSWGFPFPALLNQTTTYFIETVD